MIWSRAAVSSASARCWTSCAIRLSNLALILADLGELGAARPLAERTVAIDEAALGPDHPHTRTIRAVRDGIIRAAE